MSALIALLLPKILVSIYVKIIIIIAIFWYIQIIKIPFPNNYNDRFGELELQDEIFWVNLAIAMTPIILKLVYFSEDEDKKFYDEYSDFFEAINYLIFIVYGLFAAYLLTLFYGDFFAGYQPAYQGYLVVIASIVIFGGFTYLVTSNQRNYKFRTFKRYFQFFSYSLCGAMSALLIFSLIIPFIKSR